MSAVFNKNAAGYHGKRSIFAVMVGIDNTSSISQATSSTVFEDELPDIPAVPPLSDSDLEPSLDMLIYGGLFEILSDNYLTLLLCLWITVNTRYSESQALYRTFTSTPQWSSICSHTSCHYAIAPTRSADIRKLMFRTVELNSVADGIDLLWSADLHDMRNLVRRASKLQQMFVDFFWFGSHAARI